MVCAATPSDPAWGLGAEFAAVLAPMWRIVLASILAEVASQMANTGVPVVVTRVTRRHQWARTLISNGVAIPIDNVIFAVGAFGWTLPWGTVAQIFMFNLVVKLAMTIVSIPLVYTVRDPESFD